MLFSVSNEGVGQYQKKVVNMSKENRRREDKLMLSSYMVNLCEKVIFDIKGYIRH